MPLKIAALVGAGMLLSSCANALTGRSYLGVDSTSLPASLQSVHARAKAGDKHAQYDLALAFKDGDGVAQNCEMAKSLLRLAATSSGGRLWVYSPPVGNGTSGRVIPVNTGPKTPGLAKARTLLDDSEFCKSPARSRI